MRLLGACDSTYPCCRRCLRNHWPFNFLAHASNSAPHTGVQPLTTHTLNASRCRIAPPNSQSRRPDPHAGGWGGAASHGSQIRTPAVQWRGPARLTDPHGGGCGSASPHGLQPRKPADVEAQPCTARSPPLERMQGHSPAEALHSHGRGKGRKGQMERDRFCCCWVKAHAAEVVGFGGARMAFYSTRSTSASSKLIQRFKCRRHDFIWAETGQIYQMGRI